MQNRSNKRTNFKQDEDDLLLLLILRVDSQKNAIYALKWIFVGVEITSFFVSGLKFMIQIGG